MTESGQVSRRHRMTQISDDTRLTWNRSKCYAYVPGLAGYNSLIGQSETSQKLPEQHQDPHGTLVRETIRKRKRGDRQIGSAELKDISKCIINKFLSLNSSCHSVFTNSARKGSSDQCECT